MERTEITLMWKQKFIGLGGIFFMLIILSACHGNEPSESNHNQQSSHDHHQEKNVSTEPLKVEILTPDKLPVNQESILEAQLTQGDERVNDAQEVQFEVWQENRKKQSEMINAKREKDGIYIAKKTFQEDGVYYVQAHATARGMHVMPVKKIVVGDGAKDSDKDSPSHEQEQDSDHHH